MRNKLLFLLGIFIFVMIPKSVFAAQVYPWYAKLDTIEYVASPNGYSNYLETYLQANASRSFNIKIQSYDYDSLGVDESFSKYPYILFYFQTWNEQGQFSLSKQAACNNSCFKQNSTSLYYLGRDAITQRHQYVLVFQAGKWQLDCGVGSGQCVYTIEDNITITNGVGSGRTFIWYNVVLSDTNDFKSVADYSSIINSANTNTQNIINSANNNTQNIINNDNTNTQNIINNQNSNAQQAHQDSQAINNSLNDETGVADNDVSSKTNEWTSKLAGTGPVSNMVLMPITLLNGYISGFNSTCSPYNLGSFYGTDIILPCISISNYLGSTLWGVIDILFSGFMIYAIGKKFVKIFNDFTNLRDNQMDELYGGGK